MRVCATPLGPSEAGNSMFDCRSRHPRDKVVAGNSVGPGKRAMKRTMLVAGALSLALANVASAQPGGGRPDQPTTRPAQGQQPVGGKPPGGGGRPPGGGSGGGQGGPGHGGPGNGGPGNGGSPGG